MSTAAVMIEMDICATPERIWKAWTDPAELSTWFTMNANVKPEPGGPYELFWEPDYPERNSTLGCTVLEARRGQKLAFTWKGPIQFAYFMNNEPSTSVTLTFKASDSGMVTVRLRHAGWREGVHWRQARMWHESAWRAALTRLKSMLECQAK
jgi:uncharacterized protein YndB with AHSA1/START domain